MYKIIKFFKIFFLLLSIAKAAFYDISCDDCYEVELSKNLPEDVILFFKEYSSLIRLKKKKTHTELNLKKRVKDDVKLLKRILKLYGYFDSKVSFSIKKNLIFLKIDLKTRYKINEIIFSEYIDIITKKITFKVGDFLDGTVCLLFSKIIKDTLSNNGYPNAFVDDPECIIDKDSKTVKIKFDFQKKDLFYIKNVNITGLKKIKKEYVQNRLKFKINEIYDQKKIDLTKKTLLETGKFSNVTITNSNNSDIGLKISELAPKSITIGAKYSTSEKLGGTIRFCHDNLFGGAEKLDLSFHKNTKETLTKIDFDVPDFLKQNQTIKTTAFKLSETKIAYTSRTYTVGSSIERFIKEWFSYSVGVRVENAQIVRESEIFKPLLYGIPIILKANWSNSILNPTSGIKMQLSISPYLGAIKKFSSTESIKSDGMTILSGEIKGYIPFFEENFVIANFLKSGTCFVKNLDLLPPTKRFYLGGGDSVRAYGLQMLSPIDSLGIPIGGRSFIEMGSEFRFKLSNNFGFVTFIEGGSVTQNEIPIFNKAESLWGLGVGVRYFSQIGPIRFDFAFPMKRRSSPTGRKLDSAFQFYVSVGQAF